MTEPTSSDALEDRVASLPWPELQSALDARGFAQTPAVLSAEECRKLAALYESGSFRSRIVMARHRFGEGEYKYFAKPAAGRGSTVARSLLPTARRGRQSLGRTSGRGHPLSQHAPVVPAALSPGRADAPDAAHAALLAR